MSFTSLKKIIQDAESKGTTIYRLMLNNELNNQPVTEEELLGSMKEQLEVMIESVRKGTEEIAMSTTGITGGDGYRVQEYLSNGDTIVEPRSLKVVANAMAVNEVNASMGRIVATPTAGSAGILPAVLTNMYDTGKYSKDELVKVMFTASALGLVIANQASISGAQGGCQAEIGSATAMAAGALVELRGGTPTQIGNAVGLALKNSLGLVCDPVAGLVEIPCITRNGLHALTAMAAADMALAEVRSIIPPDEVIDAMESISQELPASLRETGIGGVAGTPTAQEIKNQVFGDDSELELADYLSAYEIIGPVMIGPSSSHTAGACRIGNVARMMLDDEPEEVVFTLMDSFAKTYQGHGTDVALIAGVLGYSTKDPEIKNAKELADEVNLKYNFLEKNLGDEYHPNTARVHLWGKNGTHIQMIGSSVGGGKVEVKTYNQYPTQIASERPTLIIEHKDKPGYIAQFTNYIAESELNISRLANRRTDHGGDAVTIFELDSPINQQFLDAFKKAHPYIDKAIIVQTN